MNITVGTALAAVRFRFQTLDIRSQMQRRQVLRIAATVPKNYCLLSWGRGAVQMSENRNQISDAVQAAFTQNCSYAENLMFSVVGAGLSARPRAVR